MYSLTRKFSGNHLQWFSRHASELDYHARKNKIAYHLINWVKKLKYHKGVINEQRAKVSGMCDIPNSSYSAKGIAENYSTSVYYRHVGARLSAHSNIG